MRISSPPTQWPCYYGVDTPTRAELIASSHSVEEINQYITSDTLAYLSLDSLKKAVMAARVPAMPRKGHLPIAPASYENGASDEVPESRPLDAGSFCHACWSGEYPIRFTPAPKKLQLRLLHV